MKLRGSPTAILAIGAGVFIAALGFTGKWADVFNVLKGAQDAVENIPGNVGINKCSKDTDCTDGKTCQGGVCQNPPGNLPPAGKSCQRDPDCERGKHCIGNKCTSTEEPGLEGVCPSDRIPINVASSAGGEVLKCAQAADLVAAKNGQCPSAGTIQVTRLDANRVACWKTVRGAGRGPVASYYDESPTGVTTLRGAPRERL